MMQGHVLAQHWRACTALHEMRGAATASALPAGYDLLPVAVGYQLQVRQLPFIHYFAVTALLLLHVRPLIHFSAASAYNHNDHNKAEHRSS